MPELQIHPLLKHPEHQEIAGRILLGYVELETNLLSHLAGPLKTVDHAVRVIFRLRSEASRLEVADAILRPFYSDLKLAGTYTQWLGAVRRCKLIRNQYAHGVWDPSKRDIPRIANLDETASSPEGMTTLAFREVSIELMREQEAFFVYTEELMYHLLSEGRFKRDRRRTRRRTPRPKALPLPLLHSPPH